MTQAACTVACGLSDGGSGLGKFDSLPSVDHLMAATQSEAQRQVQEAAESSVAQAKLEADLAMRFRELADTMRETPQNYARRRLLGGMKYEGWVLAEICHGDILSPYKSTWVLGVDGATKSAVDSSRDPAYPRPRG